MAVLLTNNATSTLASSLTPSATSLTVAAGTGAKFPSPVAPDYFYATIISTTGEIEIVKVTSRTNDVLIIVRAQDNTIAKAFPSRSRVEARINAKSVLDAVDDGVAEVTVVTNALDARLDIAEPEIDALQAAVISLDSRLDVAEPEIDALQIATRSEATLSSLLANNTFTYTAGSANTVVAGDTIRTRREDFSYRVAASGATDHHLITAGGIKLYVLPTSAGYYNFASIAPAADGATDDYPKLKMLLDTIRNAGPVPGLNLYTAITPIYVPNGTYFMGQTINLKSAVHLYGNGSNGNQGCATFKFANNITGIIVNSVSTINATVEAVPTGSGGGSIIEGITLCSNLGTNTSAHGIWLRARAVIRDVHIYEFGGNGINIVATSGGPASEEGNANSWVIDGVAIRNVGCNGIYAQGADANAGSCTAADVMEAHLWGIFDSSFLGNTWVACHTANCGIAPLRFQTCYASYGGLIYQARSTASSATLGSTQPGTNANVWLPYTTSLPPDWVIAWTGSNPAGTYRPGGSYCSGQDTAISTFVGCYSEDGQGYAQFARASIAIGCQFFATPVIGSYVRSTFGGYPEVPGLFAYRETKPANSLTPNSRNATYLSEGGGVALTIQADDGASVNTGAWRWKRDGTGWRIDVNDADAAVVYRMTGSSDLFPYRLKMREIVFGENRFARSDSLTPGVVVPTSGFYYQGDLAFSQVPVAGNKIGWVCTTTGTAGSTAVFKPFGAIDP